MVLEVTIDTNRPALNLAGLPVVPVRFFIMKAVGYGVIILLLAVGVYLGAEPTTEPNKFVGSRVCQACHPDLWHGFNRNPHFKSIAREAAPPERTGCEGCHGPGELHIKGMGDTSKIFRFPEVEPHEVIQDFHFDPGTATVYTHAARIPRLSALNRAHQLRRQAPKPVRPLTDVDGTG